MQKFLMIASAAAMAVSMPAIAKPDHANKGGGGGGDHAQHAGNPGKGGGNANKGQGNGGKANSARNDHSNHQQNRKVEKAQQRQVKADRQQVVRVRQADGDWRDDRNDDRRRIARDRDGYDRNGYDRDRWVSNSANCPPGLARKQNGCLPPGQAKKILGLGQPVNLAAYRDYNVPLGYRGLYYDNPENYYRYDDNGYIYRVNRQSNLVSGLIPLLGGGFGIGQALPAGYDVYNVPIQYRDTYYDTSDAYYRYGDNAIYQVDPQSNMIESVVALLTGSNLGVGQVLPAGYDAYNLPLQYRDDYYDTDDSMYRYADGNIYQVDPKTQIIQAIISALI